MTIETRCWGCRRPTTSGIYCLTCVPGNQPGMCTTCRAREAEGWLEGVPTCCSCVELVVERLILEDADPWATIHLPELDATAFLVARSHRQVADRGGR